MQAKEAGDITPLEDEEHVTLAEAVRRISESSMRLQRSGLNEAAIIALIHDADPKLGKKTIKRVFEVLSQLKERYTQ